MKLLLQLLKSISSNRKDLDIKNMGSELVEFSIESGLAPYLIYNSDKSIKSPDLVASDLTVKMITQIQLDALDELISIASPLVDEIILLKGIAISQIYYPMPHLRIMSDIDILVSKKDSITIENTLGEIGYKQMSIASHEFYKTHHHSMPFYNKDNNVWIEVHTHLFSDSTPVLDDKLFEIDNILNNTIDNNIDRYPANIKYLSPELQLIYTCTHWAEDFNINKGCIQIIDMILIIKNNNNQLDWNKIYNWLRCTSAASNMYLILSYFEKNRIIDTPENYSNNLVLKNNNMGYLNRVILHKIIDDYFLGIKYGHKIYNDNLLEIVWDTLLAPSTSLVNLTLLPWNILFPPIKENRYKINLLLKRARNMFK